MNNNTVTFLNALGKLSDAFFVVEKHQQCQLNTLKEAIDLTRKKKNINIYQNHNLPNTLNGPEGIISYKTY